MLRKGAPKCQESWAKLCPSRVLTDEWVLARRKARQRKDITQRSGVYRGKECERTGRAQGMQVLPYGRAQCEPEALAEMGPEGVRGSQTAKGLYVLPRTHIYFQSNRITVHDF